MPAELPSRYRVIEEVGQGGMAVVYRAHDATLRREVAVKVLHPHLLAEGESKARLEREAQAVAKLQHDNIVQIYDYSGQDSPSSFIVTEFIDGQTLKQFLGDRSFPLPELAACAVIEIASAVEHAHGLGILHRDIKPENVMVRKDGMLKLMDFGVAQVIDLERMTVTGQLIGSPAYMAPELIEGKPVDRRTDVFALGIMLYQLTTGALPFSGRNPHEVFKRITDATYPDPRSKNPLVGTQIQRVIARALARKPDDRYPDMTGLIADLRAFVGEAGITDARKTLAGYFIAAKDSLDGLRNATFAGLLASARTARRERRTARALELWNRALALRPDDVAALSEIRSLQGGRSMRRGALVLAGCTLVGVAAWAIVRRPPESAHRPGARAERAPHSPERSPMVAPPPPLPDRPEAAPAVPPTGAARPHVAERPVERREPRGPTSTDPGAAPKPPVVPAPPRTFSLGPTPQNASIWLDGKKLFDFGPGHNTVEVPWDGLHTVEFRSACCFPHAFELGPSRTPADLTGLIARLQPKPASLTIVTRPPRPGARVLLSELDGKKGSVSSETGKAVSVRFDENDEFVKSLDVTVFVDDRAVAHQEIVVKAGEVKEVPFDLL